MLVRRDDTRRSIFQLHAASRPILGFLVSFLLLTAPATADWNIDLPASSTSEHIALPVPEDAKLERGQFVQLVERGESGVSIPAQLSPHIDSDGKPSADKLRLLATIPPCTEQNTSRRFRVQVTEQAHGEPPFHFVDVEQRSLKLLEGTAPIFVYNYGTITNPAVPENDSRRSRGCYLHPVWGVHGEVLTADFPADHFHHHGIFWAWPYVRVNDRTFDLWEYRNIQQRFVTWLHRETGPVAAVFGVENGWFVGDRKVVTERVWFTTYETQPENRTIDCSIVLNAEQAPVTLQGREGKSYGGLVLRFDVWPRRDAHILVKGRTLRHEGKGLLSEQDLSNTPLAWVGLTSLFPGAPGRSGAAVFIHPSHPDYPPTWLTRSYGPQCVGWPGIKPHTLEPGRPVDLQYRFWIHGNEPTPDELDQQYNSYQQIERSQMDAQ
jgi:hypothetical protein